MMIKSVIVWMTKEKEGKESKLHARAHLMFHRPDAKELLESKLPDYIAQSFLKCGFDEIEDIAEMDVGEGPNNSISVMEKYIDKKRFPECMGPNQLDDEPFEFPPGHRLKIKRFITEVKQMHKPQRSLKRKVKSPRKRSKKIKTDDSPSISLSSLTSSESEQSDLSTCSTIATINAATNEIRAKVLKWGKKQNLNLVENQHFTITVKYHPSDDKKVCASIRCGCGNNYIINQKANSWLISNWSRHYQSCTYDKNEQGRQDTLAHYFQPAAQLDPPTAVLSDNSSEHHSEHHLTTRTCKSQVFY